MPENDKEVFRTLMEEISVKQIGGTIRINITGNEIIGADRLWNYGTPEKALKVLFKNRATVDKIKAAAKKAGFLNKRSRAKIGMNNINTNETVLSKSIKI